MNRRSITPLLIPLKVCAALTVALFVAIFASRTYAQEPPAPLAPGVPMQGEVTNRLGQAWLLYVCAGDHITVTATSESFSPYVELLAPPGSELIGEASGDEQVAVLHSASISPTGIYTVNVSGELRSDRGPYTMSAQFAAGTQIDDATGSLSFDASVTSTLRSSRGDAWLLHACEGRTVSVTMASSAFAPLLEVLDSTQVTSVATAEAAESGAIALARFDPPVSADYWVIAAGSRRSDRGPYTLSVSIANTETEVLGDAQGASSQTPTRAPTSTRTPTRAPTATRTATPTTASCEVLVQGLNLRSGPGTNYEPPIGNLSLGTILRPTERDAASAWVHVEAPGTEPDGWVSGAAQYIACNVAIGSLPVAAILPPTPTPVPSNTPTSTPTRTPIPTPTTPAIVLIPNILPSPTPPGLILIPGGSGNALPGNVYSGPNVGVPDFNTFTTVYRNQIWFRLEPEAPQGRRVDHVIFRVFDPNFSEVHTRRENTYGYCAFGGGEPICNSIELEAGAVWPSSGLPMENGPHSAAIEVYLDGDPDGNPTATWNVNFVLDSPDLTGGGNGVGDIGADTVVPAEVGEDPAPVTEPEPIAEAPPDLVLELVETSPGTSGDISNGLVTFRVTAWDPAVGEGDGDGIEQVSLEIAGPNGVVHQRTEGNPAFCAFGGGEPECNVYDLNANGFVWESGVAHLSGIYTLRATVLAEDGRVRTREWSINIQ